MRASTDWAVEIELIASNFFEQPLETDARAVDIKDAS